MAAESCHIGAIEVGPRADLLIIAGPCVLESAQVNSAIGGALRDLCAALRINYIFKASFDKANRSSIRSSRGPGLDAGLEELSRLKRELGVPVTTDVHEPEQARRVAEVVDLLQVPAFLCRQTDLLMACAQTGRAVNVKKGQFMAPSEMKNVLAKLGDGGCANRMLTERGTFFGYHRLVNDFVGVGDLMDLGAPVCFDITHSTQLPGAGEGGANSAGRPERAPLLARAAAAAGVPAMFFECHPEPHKASSDQATMLALDAIPGLLRDVVAVRQAIGLR